MRRCWLGFVLCAAISCGDGADLGFAVALEIAYDGAVTDAQIATVASYAFHASGDETFTQSVKTPRAQRNERVLYRPLASTRTLMLVVDAVDAAGAIIAKGTGPSLTLASGTTHAGLILKAEGQAECGSSADCDEAHVCDGMSRCVLPTTCRALKRAHDAAPSGLYTIAPSSGSLAVYCDMTGDGGGWMLVTEAMIASEMQVGTTVTRGVGDHGGLTMAVEPTIPGCNGNAPKAMHLLLFKDPIEWRQIRARYRFIGKASCWSVFGDRSFLLSTYDPNVYPFTTSLDLIHDEVKMGGSAGDLFDGKDSRCDTDTKNFWGNGTADRSVVLGLRRKVNAQPSGFATQADCLDLGGTSWTYSEIFIRED